MKDLLLSHMKKYNPHTSTLSYYLYFHLNHTKLSLTELYSLMLMLVFYYRMQNCWDLFSWQTNILIADEMISTPYSFVQEEIINNIDNFVENIVGNEEHFMYDIKMHNKNGVGVVIDFIVDNCLYEIKCGWYDSIKNTDSFYQLLFYAIYLKKLKGIEINKLCEFNPRENKWRYWSIETELKKKFNSIYDKFLFLTK